MPSKNRVKTYAAESYYHVYNRGVEGRRIFLEEKDYVVFLNLLKRYLSGDETKDLSGRIFDDLSVEVDLLAYCLMPTHFHLLLYQTTEQGMTRLLRRLMTSYSMYFNKKYKRFGTLFQDRFKASLISRDDYLQHISRYLHLNPRDYRTWKYSSLPYYFNKKSADWLKPAKITALFGPGEYARFMADYEAHKAILDELKYELADTPSLQGRSLQAGIKSSSFRG